MKIVLHKYFLVYLSVVVLFFLLDFIWLGWIAQDFYHRQLGELLSHQVVWPAAIAFYLVYLIGLMIFSITPALHRTSLLHASVMGALYGFFTYATYELTNYALIRGWPAGLVTVDIVWGTLLCASVSTWGYWVGRRLANR